MRRIEKNLVAMVTAMSISGMTNTRTGPSTGRRGAMCLRLRATILRCIARKFS